MFVADDYNIRMDDIKLVTSNQSTEQIFDFSTTNYSCVETPKTIKTNSNYKYAITRHVTTHTDTIPCGWPILYTNVTMKKGSDVQIPILGVPTRNFRQASNLLSTRVTGTIGLGQ